MAKIPSFERLLRDPKARESLTDLQLYNFLEQVRSVAAGLGRPSVEPDPASFAVRLSRGEWRAADHLRLLSTHLSALERREQRFLAVSMPPRHGKSQLIDVWFPIWWLTRNPRARIILAGYGETFARLWGAQVRDKFIELSEETNVRISKDQTAADDWQTTLGGGMVCVGVGGSLTGRGADLLIIDDPIKNDQEANSLTYRERMWNWWQASAFTRLQPNGVTVVVACLAGDTPILRADGTETPIRDLRVGDQVATFEDGRVTSSIVRNWANQGPDYLLAIRTKSGRLVRANARHPFLAERKGRVEWRRTDTLRKGDAILRVIEGGGEEFSVPQKGVESQSLVRDSALPTTTSSVGRAGIVHRLLSIHTSAVTHTFGVVMALGLKNTINFLRSKMAHVLSASNHLQLPTQDSTDCSLTIATTKDTFVDCSVIPAISSSDTQSVQKSSKPQLITYDEVVSVHSVNVEDVYDIEVERTHNFIANGLVTHNTRWHEDDLIGRIIREDSAKRWTYLNLPALAEANDPLGRPLGTPLWPEQWKDDDPDYSIRRGSMSPYWWSAQFQGSPTPEGGGLIQRDWFRFYSSLPEDCDQWIQSWDPALLDKASSDYWVGQVWARRGACLYLVDSARGHYNLAQATGIIRSWQLRYPKATAKLVENSAMGPAVIQTLQHEVPGLIPWPPRRHQGGQRQGSKRSRVEAIVPVLMAGNVYLPENKDGTKARWVWDLVEECAAFDKGTHDDQVDALSQAVAFLLPSAWQHERREDEIASTPPPPSPREALVASFNAYSKDVLAKAARRFSRRPGSSTARW